MADCQSWGLHQSHLMTEGEIMNVCIVGTGYVGLSTGVCLAYLGHQVNCLDVDEQKIAGLNNGTLPIYEPGLKELFDSSRHNLTFTSDPAEAMHDAKIVFITVGTPSLEDGRANLQYVEAAAKMAGQHLNRHFTVVVVKSTVPIGTNGKVARIVRSAFCQSHPGHLEPEFAMASNPEFLRQGSAIHDSLYPDRIVIGSNSTKANEKLKLLYRHLVDQTFEAPEFLPRPEGFPTVLMIATDLASAEMIKYAANAFLGVKISFANELAELSEHVRADISQVIQGVGSDRRIGSLFLQAGLGWGGSCFGKDTAALLNTGLEYGLNMRIVRAARDVNYSQPERVIAKLRRELGTLEGKVVGLLGLAFKPHTDDLRDAPALEIGRQLLQCGAEVRGHDPVARPGERGSGIQLCATVSELTEGAHALILATEWPQYQSLPWKTIASAMSDPLLLDGRNALSRQQMEWAGFRYFGIGRAYQPSDLRQVSPVSAVMRNPIPQQRQVGLVPRFAFDESVT